jgi:hypothetical protein
MSALWSYDNDDEFGDDVNCETSTSSSSSFFLQIKTESSLSYENL